MWEEQPYAIDGIVNQSVFSDFIIPLYDEQNQFMLTP